MHVELPPELCESVVNHIPADDIATIRSCLLVSRAYCDASERRLFAHVRLGEAARPYSRIAELFAARPHLAAYVTSMRLELPDDEDRWREEKPIAESVFRPLRNIAQLDIDGGMPVQPESPLVGLRIRALGWMLGVLEAHGTLQHIMLWHVSLTKSLFHRVISVVPSLNLHGAGLIDEPEFEMFPGTPTPVPQKSIEHLENDSSIKLYDLLLRPEYEQCVAGLRSWTHRRFIEPEELRPCFLSAATLEYLELRLASDWICHIAMVHALRLPSSMPALVQLVLRINPCTPPPCVIELLSSNGAPALAVLLFRFTEPPLVDPEDARYSFDPETFAALDDAVVAHPSLRAVEWRLLFRRWDMKRVRPGPHLSPPVQFLINALHAYLPQACRKEIVRLSDDFLKMFE
ncbi:hypothetical protein MIND_00182900 [Mycena indigotica]|uniref:F-box domain-containing protein n=1 Tax=Mycena indigotica TaxID=2126181 RepID=A0A8H6WAM2_9AGAR|nr:uncharacterized protein MIND_00182900 [Mycena indigotica]KAF7311729.1 hypothetical protein MIND_00182900 [Mycena indigotica]